MVSSLFPSRSMPPNARAESTTSRCTWFDTRSSWSEFDQSISVKVSIVSMGTTVTRASCNYLEGLPAILCLEPWEQRTFHTVWGQRIFAQCHNTMSQIPLRQIGKLVDDKIDSFQSRLAQQPEVQSLSTSTIPGENPFPPKAVSNGAIPLQYLGKSLLCYQKEPHPLWWETKATYREHELMDVLHTSIE